MKQWLDFDPIYSIKTWPGLRFGTEMSQYQRGMNEDPNMLQMYGYMPPFGPNDMSMFDGKSIHPRDYPFLRGPSDSFPVNEGHTEGRGYPMNMPFPPPEMFDSSYPPNARFQRGESSAAGNIPSLQSSSGDGTISRGIPWEYGMLEYQLQHSSKNPSMSWQGPPPGPGYFVGRQYPPPYGNSPGPNQENEK